MRLVHVTLSSDDLAVAIPFYRGLGLRPLVIEPDAAGAPVYARFTFPEGDGTLSLERRRPGTAPAGGAVIAFECSDLDRRVAELGAAGYRFDEGPVTRPWMWREAALTDPDGHRLHLIETAGYRLDPPWRLAGSAVPAPPAGGGGAPQIDLGVLDRERNHGYLEAALPSGRDEQVAALVRAVAGATPERRDATVDRLGPASSGTLLAFAERMASLTVRLGGGAAAGEGLLAVGLAWRRCRDVRAAIPVLAVLYDAARRTGADAAALFEDAARALPPDVAPALRDFLTRPDLAEIAETMGYALRSDRDGPRYARLWGAGQIAED
jgi:catechol 2,3-dioxygenase-like lactoylglutathione lyase family enzyme